MSIVDTSIPGRHDPITLDLVAQTPAERAVQVLRVAGFPEPLLAESRELLTDVASVSDGVKMLLTRVFQGSPYAQETVLDRLCPEQGFVRSTESSEPHVIAGFPIVRKLGAGASAGVYLSQGPSVIKIQEGSDKTVRGWRRRFANEIEIMREIASKPIVTEGFVPKILDHGEVQNRLWYRMSRVNGYPLDALLAQAGKPLSAALVDHMALQLSQTIHALHEAGVLHRDIKLANVLLDAQGRLVVTDFGTAFNMNGGGDGLTRAGGIVGTPDYMNLPGYLNQGALSVDDVQNAAGEDHLPQRDTYALGVLLYQLYFGASLYNLSIRGYAPRPDPALFRDRELGGFLRRMTDINPNNRPSTAEMISFFQRRVQVPDGQEKSRFLRMPSVSEEGTDDRYAPRFKDPADQFAALSAQYSQASAVVEGERLKDTVVLLNTADVVEQQRRRSRRRFLLWAGVATASVAAGLPLFRPSNKPADPMEDVRRSPPKAPTPPRIIRLEDGGALRISPSEDGVGGDIHLSTGMERELTLSATSGLHVYRGDAWVGSLHFPTSADVQRAFGLSDQAVKELYLLEPVAFSYFSEPEAMTYLPGIGVFFRQPDGTTKPFRASDSDALRTIGILWNGSVRDTLVDPDGRRFWMGFDTDSEVTHELGAMFHSPDSVQPDEWRTRWGMQLQAFQQQIEGLVPSAPLSSASH